MSRLFTGLITAAAISIAVPASAFSLQLNFPTLTYPTPPSPEVGQACTDLTSVTGGTCDTTAK